MKAVKRQKALVGTEMLIGTILSSLIGAGAQIYGAKTNADAIREQNKNNLFAQNFNNSLNQQQNLRAVYNNQDEIDLLKRFNALPTLNQFKCGGMKIKRK